MHTSYTIDKVPLVDIPYCIDALTNINGNSLIEFSRSIDLKELSICEVHNLYFKHAIKNDLNKTKGVIKTPSYIADFMVSECVNESKQSVNKISWLDPCSGSGIFPEAILKNYFNNSLTRDISNLPLITAKEISPIGYVCTYLVIAKILLERNLSIEDYLISERLNLLLVDALEVNNANLFESARISERYDFVIANPPFVRATRLTSTYKKILKTNYPKVYSGNADLYYYFIANGLDLVNDNGKLCFICQANFFRSTTAKPLRMYIGNNSHVLSILDLDELKIFPDADLHSTIFLLSKNKSATKPSSFKYSHIKNIEEIEPLKNGTHVFSSNEYSSISNDGWVIKDPKSKNIDISILDSCQPLSAHGFKIYSGIRPGVKNAFVYSHEKIKNLDPLLMKQWFMPYLAAGKINKWTTGVIQQYLLFIPENSPVPPKEIMDLLTGHENSLSLRSEVKNKERWYELRKCNYYDIFKRQHIVFPDICRKPRFSLEYHERLILDGAFIIDSFDLALLGILNSDIACDYFLTHCSSIGNVNGKGRIRLKKSHVVKLPIPKYFSTAIKWRKKIGIIVQTIIEKGENQLLLEQLNDEVNKFYSKYHD